MLYSQFSLVTYFIHSGVCMAIPISQSIPPPPSLLDAHVFALYVHVSRCTLQISSSVPFF